MSRARFKLSEVHSCTGGSDILILDRTYNHQVVRTYKANSGGRNLTLLVRRAQATLELAKLNAWDRVH